MPLHPAAQRLKSCRFAAGRKDTISAQCKTVSGS